jgi:hypothetical protein
VYFRISEAALTPGDQPNYCHEMLRSHQYVAAYVKGLPLLHRALSVHKEIN